LDSNRQGEQTSVKRQLRRLFSAAAAFFPISLLRRWLAWSVRDLCIALCFHRVSAQKRATDPQPELTVAPEVLDELLAFLTSSMPVAPAQLFLCFDDGYADAANYVAARAPFHSSVQWLFFVCPEKTERGRGFDGIFSRRPQKAKSAVPILTPSWTRTSISTLKIAALSSAGLQRVGTSGWRR
jgi:hypothetical protein